MQTLILSILLSVSILAGDPVKKTEKSIENKKGWISLFDGKTTKGWHSYGKSVAGEAWKVEDGSLHLDAGKNLSAGDIVTDESFDNFDLKLEWKISKNGNSGIIFYIQDDPKKYDYIWYTGPEMQVLDNDGHSDGKIIKHRAGNLYDLIEGKEGVVKAVGEWNQVEIISNKGKLDLMLNGVTVVSTTVGDDNWRNLIAGSKFKTKPDFGKVFSGHIGLQDHGNEVWFRDIKIKKL
jgi:Domain of Unknown Function (DUF1080)